MKIVIVSMEVKSGKCEENFSYMAKQIEQAKKDKAQMIVFPQNAISGYMLGDVWNDNAWCNYVDSFNELLIAMADDIAIVWGNIKFRAHSLFNAAFFAYQGQTHMCVKKKSKSPFAMDSNFEELAIQSSIEFQDQIFALNFGNEIQMADFNINLDAHAFDVHAKRNFHGNVIYVNSVGMQNCGKSVVVMEGGSFLMHQSDLKFQVPFGDTGSYMVDLDNLEHQEPQSSDLLKMLRLAIQGFDEQVFGKRFPWIVGLSGGLDSSVSAALLVDALGKERVFGYGMSTTYNSDKTKNNAKQSAELLGVVYREGSIEPLVQASEHVLHTYGYEEVQGLTLENIQARLRGHLLSSFASLHGGVVVNNGNKVENALGYCTLYGDAIGALGVLGDLTKVQLFALAKQLNVRFEKEVIPVSLLPTITDTDIHFDVAPAAELKDNQKDPMKWYYHDYLVDHLGRDMSLVSLLKSYIDGSLLQSEIGDIMRIYHLDEPSVFLEDFDWFTKTMGRNAFKHLQVPPIISLSCNAFAFRQNVQANVDQGYIDELCKKITKM